MVDLKDQDLGEGMQCITHPYTKNPGGICPLCLQEKLGKLVTSSFPNPNPNPKPNPSSSSSPKPFSPSSTSLALSLSSGRDNNNNNNNNNLPFLLAKKKQSMLAASSSSSSSSTSSSNLIYKRSKSTAAAYGERKRSGFWSFLHLYSSKHQISAPTKKVDNFSLSSRPRNQKTETPKRVVGGGIDVIVEEEDESPVVETPTNGVGSGSGGGSSFGRKVLRSRSVGCGSRSFSGDFFERIGFGDCALRRIESQREPTKAMSNGADAMSEMVKCGGIFGGFMIMTPSSSSTTSTSSTVDHHHNHHHKMGNRSAWGWAFASPMRAKTTHRDRTITESSTEKNSTPNLDSVPSLVTMKS